MLDARLREGERKKKVVIKGKMNQFVVLIYVESDKNTTHTHTVAGLAHLCVHASPAKSILIKYNKTYYKAAYINCIQCYMEMEEYAELLLIKYTITSHYITLIHLRP